MEVGNKAVRHRAEHSGSQRPAIAITRAYTFELIIKHLSVGGGFTDSEQMTVGTEQSSYHISSKHMNRLLSLFTKDDALIFISIFMEYKFHPQSYAFIDLLNSNVYMHEVIVYRSPFLQRERCLGITEETGDVSK